MVMDMKTRVNGLGQPVGEELPGWSARPRPPQTPMQGRLCRLESFDLARHAHELFEAYSLDVTGRNWTYLGYGPFETEAGFTALAEASFTGSDPHFHTVIDLASGKAVGVASYLRIDPACGVIEVGHIHFSPAMQARPIATEAMYLMMARAFDELGYRRYEWKCDALNAPSQSAAQRLGFTYEGTFRQATIYKGRNRDTAWYSILDSEWPALKTAFEAWLDPANFDADGRQRQRLSALRSR
jgi:RimJ/RimL family protein N-acetyltransferase